MPPVPTPPLHRITPSAVAVAVAVAVAIAVVTIFRPLLHVSAVAHVCSTTASTTTTSCSSVSLLSYPFSQVPGCGHPAFQIRCSASHWIISINNISFTIKERKPNSTFLFISPVPNYQRSDRSFCSSPISTLIPNRSIDLSGSPFRFPHSLCSRFSVVRPCPHSNAPNCSVCNWECELVDSPVRLLQGCETNRREDSEQGCKEDVLDYLESFLKLGFPVEWSEDRDSYFSNCRACQASNGVCGFNSSDPKTQFLCFRSQSHEQSRLPPPRNIKPTSNLIVLLCTLFILSCLLVVIAVATLIWRCRGIKASPNEEEEGEDPTIMFLRHRSADLLPPVFTFEELESSTNRFDPRRKIGDGGFGSVYLGQLYDGRVVAVKRLHRRPQPASNKSFCNEILILSSIDHPNLVKLHGYCSDPRALLLVYDYVPNGTLADHLHGSKTRKGSLTWQVRVEVALQTALAIEYLHFSVVPAIVHRDITSSNIFVDKDMRIKLGDFGLSRLLIFGPESSSGSGSLGSGSDCIWTGPQGTPGYLDPDYHRSFRLTEKSDVYSFGVVMFELISGMKAVDVRREKREVGLADLVVSKIQLGSLHQVVDPAVVVVDGDGGGGGGGGSDAIGTVDAMAELAFRCVAADKDDRPDAKEVVAELKRIRSRTRGGPRASNSSDACNNY